MQTENKNDADADTKAEPDAESEAPIKRANRCRKKQNLPRREALFVFQFNANADALR
ncbi:hypothetical protein PQR71_05495 [Paraburkholderia fungorum]|uniref:hypothetical protein n=1 Tax=Paraburkholderia fungorum TaxID=134537 RepID=UPI0038BDE93A